jgi:cytochrome oxidase Cu insertion factor (SCO1/SenC/PrrC family)
MKPLALALSLGVILATTVFVLLPRPAAKQPQETGRADIRAQFDLVDPNGQKVTQADFQGKYLLVYLGYTFCPDICPTSLLSMMQAAQTLNRDDLVVMFISVDPERDTPEQIKNYADNFPGLVALTGSAEQVKQAAQSFRVYYKKQEQEGSTDYLMDHSSLIYLMGPDGQYLAHFPHTAPVETLVAGIQKTLGE